MFLKLSNKKEGMSAEYPKLLKCREAYALISLVHVSEKALYLGWVEAMEYTIWNRIQRFIKSLNSKN